MDASGERRRTRRRRAPVAVAVVLVLCAVAAVAAVNLLRAAARSDFDAAHTEFLGRQAQAMPLIDAAETALAEAESALRSSAGKVLTEHSRDALSAAVEEAGDEVDAARGDIASTAASAEASAAASAGVLDVGSGLRDGSATLASFTLASAAALSDVPDALHSLVVDVTDDVAAWQSEQERILRERYTNHVHAVGWIPELDECKGSVDLTAHYGTPAIAEHWSCGGKNFPDDPGTIITLTGVRAGTYRVEGIVLMLNQHRATIADIPHGYDLLYQTCQNGQSATMSLTALTKIG